MKEKFIETVDFKIQLNVSNRMVLNVIVCKPDEVNYVPYIK